MSELTTPLSARPVRKISIIAPDLVAGGMTRAYALAEALAHAGYRVEIFGVKLTQGSLYPLPPASVSIRRVRGRNRWHSLLRLVKQLDGDVVYAIKPRLSSFGVALLKKWLSRIPVVLDIDDWEIGEITAARQTCPLVAEQSPSSVVARVRRWLNPANTRYISWLDRLIDRADAITVNTRFLQTRYGGTYIPQCKDAGLYDPQKHDPATSRQRYGLSAYTVVMFPGTARPHKGLEDILEAMDSLQFPDLRLVIVGGRSTAHDYVAQLMERWEHWIIRLPKFSQEEMPAIVAAAHVIVVPQRDTGVARAQFPMKLTDGMAMGKPVITTIVGDIPEIISGCGYLVPPSSPGQLAKALDSIIRDPQLARERGRLARERFLSGYSLGAVAPLLSGVFDGLDKV